MGTNITGPLTNISGFLSPDLQHPRAGPIQKKLLYYSWDGLGGVETRKREKEHAVERQKAPIATPARGILSPEHVGSALETNFIFQAVLLGSISIFILARILSVWGFLSQDVVFDQQPGLFPGYADHICRVQYYHHTGKLAGDSSNFLNSPEPQTESETNPGKVGK
jgi:hypothetical protein